MSPESDRVPRAGQIYTRKKEAGGKKANFRFRGGTLSGNKK